MPPVKISEIKPGMRGLEVEGKIVSLGDAKTVGTKFGSARVAVAVLADETGSVRLNLWRNQIDTVKVGACIRLVNAFAKEYGTRAELSIGKDGMIILIERGR